MGSALMQPQLHAVTWDDYVGLPDDDRRELIDGELLEGEVPTEIHESIVIALGAALYNWCAQHGGKVLASGYKVQITAKRGVMPDVQYYKPGRGSQPKGRTDGGPDLAVEIVSPGSEGRDRVTKMAYYLSIGVAEYWLIDPQDRTLQRFLRTEQPDIGAAWLVTHSLGIEDGPFAPSTFPGLVLDLPKLFEIAE